MHFLMSSNLEFKLEHLGALYCSNIKISCWTHCLRYVECPFWHSCYFLLSICCFMLIFLVFLFFLIFWNLWGCLSVFLSLITHFKSFCLLFTILHPFETRESIRRKVNHGGQIVLWYWQHATNLVKAIVFVACMSLARVLVWVRGRAEQKRSLTFCVN
jgi:nicotinamide riboside transporter PnuC